MPHVTIEHSANVADHIDVEELVGHVHDAVLRTGIAPLDALRTRSVSRDVYAIADRHPDNAFIAVLARLGPGRSDRDLDRLIDTVMATISDLLGDSRRYVMLSVEVQEIDPRRRKNANNLRSTIAERTRGASGGC